MSFNRLEVLHDKEIRDKFSKSRGLKIGNKSIVTPTFCLRPKNAEELDLMLRLKSEYSFGFLSAYVIRLIDLQRTIYPRIGSISQINLFGQLIEDQFSSSLARDIILIDPALEYLYYDVEDVLVRLSSISFLPWNIRNYAKKCICEKKYREKGDYRKWREAFHNKFWTEILENDAERTRMIRDIQNTELRNKADILIPPVPFITSKRLLDAAILINQRSREIARGRSESADYFPLRSDMLRDEEIMNTIKKHIENSEAARLTVFKLKYLNLNNEEKILEKNSYKSLLMELSFLSQHLRNKAFMLLDGGNQLIPSAVTGFDIVSSSFNGDKEDRHIKNQRDVFAKWYDPEYLIYHSRQDLLTILRNNQGVVPCHCPVCSIPSNYFAENFIEYNRSVKMHYLFCREAEMSEIYNAIERKTTAMGADKLQRSQLKNLADLIPR
jgi:hypothetical protein